MSYARHGADSDVYVIGTRQGLECLGCRISGPPASDGLCYGWFTTSDDREMVRHLEEHRAQGWKVPQYALDRLRAD